MDAALAGVDDGFSELSGCVLREFDLPTSQREAAQAWLDQAYPAVAERPASTVIMIRPAIGPHPFDVYMVRRASTMAHQPGVVAFPGGSIRPDDGAVPLPLTTEQLDAWAADMGEKPGIAHRFIAAAAREVFEETGVLLTKQESLMYGPLAQAREAIEMHRLSFQEFMEGNSLAIDLDRLGYRGTWITPDFLPRRYRLAFFTALLPVGQEPFLASTEAVRERWGAPQEFLDRADAGEISIVVPTRIQLEELAAAASIDEALVATPRHVKYTPAPAASSPSGFVLR